MKYNELTAALILSTLLASCGTPPDNSLDLEEAKQAIAESNAIYFESFVKNDSSIFIERYAEDACILAPNSKPMCGPGAALEFFQAAYRDYGLRNGKFITTAVYGLGNDYVTEEGEWQSFDANGTMFDNGKFLVLWKKTTKGWKMYRDSFSSNQPAAVPPSPEIPSSKNQAPN